MKGRSGLGAWILALDLLVPGTLFAQAARVGRFEVGAGLGWFGGVTFAEVSATETSAGGGRKTLFTTRSELEGSTGVDARIGVRLTPRLQAESSLSFNPTRLATRVSGDFELAPNTTASEPVTQYLVEAGLVGHLARWKRRRLAPFATVGAGYLRQVNDGQTLIATGRSYYVGGGTRYLLKSPRAGRLRSAGLRADVRAIILQNGVAPDNARHVAPFVGVSVFAGF